MKRITIRADTEFKKLLDDIKIERIKRGKDRKPLSDRRLTLAITRLENLKGILLEANIDAEMKRRGLK